MNLSTLLHTRFCLDEECFLFNINTTSSISLPHCNKTFFNFSSWAIGRSRIINLTIMNNENITQDKNGQHLTI